ncbi:arginine N-succinyltransferase [Salinisphaera sp. LB1]|uniref:arginine N-succinyltransferase n=1 Tax=Salinisphaera sp. LB1 TaxID=2183911 RepID=UPI000D70762B|nr:arginine N-succinyltransferase [Salinisphaera sp. LB1]AWN15040.1 Arginine N-succinyltransferase [Salinisphaera sp. LB1]
MLIVRPGHPDDLEALMALAANAVPALTNFPAHRERLGERLAASRHALEESIASPGSEVYTFVLEDHAGESPRVVGTASIRARAGAREAYYTWRRETLIHASQQLDVRREVSILSLSHELSESSLLCAFSIDPAYRGGPGERLLRRARLLFVAQHPERFMTNLAVAMPGHLDANGASPFWESVGRHFFVRDFGEINEIAGVHSKSFIAEVMPPFPLYEPLLSETGRAAIGSIHAAHGPAAVDLRDEGFTPSRHIDLFDGGLLFEAPFQRLHSVRGNRWHPVRVDNRVAHGEHGVALLANQETSAFRCIAAPHALTATGQLRLAPEGADRLHLDTGRAVLAVTLPTLDAEAGSC